MTPEAHPYSEHYRLLDEMFKELPTDRSITLPSSDVTDITEILEHNEFGVAFDALVGVIKEGQLDVTAPYLKKIADIGTKMDLDPENWEGIRTA